MIKRKILFVFQFRKTKPAYINFWYNILTSTFYNAYRSMSPSCIMMMYTEFVYTQDIIMCNGIYSGAI